MITKYNFIKIFMVFINKIKIKLKKEILCRKRDEGKQNG